MAALKAGIGQKMGCPLEGCDWPFPIFDTSLLRDHLRVFHKAEYLAWKEGLHDQHGRIKPTGPSSPETSKYGENRMASTPISDEDPQSRSEECDECGYDNVRKAMTRYEKGVVALTAVIAGITAVYAFFSFLQWCALVDSNRINHESLVSVQRAFLFPATSRSLERIKQNNTVQTYRLNWPFQNSGTTPARQTMVISIMTFLPPEEMPPNYPLTETQMPRPPEITSIPPKGLASLALADIAPSDFAAAVAKTKFFYVWGSIGYRDVFPDSDPHIIEFCFGMAAVSLSDWNDATKDSIRVVWNGCGRHNCSDGDCPDYADKQREYLKLEQKWISKPSRPPE